MFLVKYTTTEIPDIVNTELSDGCYRWLNIGTIPGSSVVVEPYLERAKRTVTKASDVLSMHEIAIFILQSID